MNLSEKPFEYSAAGEAAFDVIEKYKECVKWWELASPSLAEQTSANIGRRWQILGEMTSKIKAIGDKYSPLMMAGIDEELLDELKEIDEENIGYNFENGHAIMSKYFGIDLKGYAGIIVAALIKEMTDEEQVMFDNAQDWNVR